MDDTPTLTTAVSRSLTQQIGRMTLFTAVALLALAVLNIIVTLPGGITAEKFLILGPARLEELQAILSAWARLIVIRAVGVRVDLQEVSVAYLSLDTIFFVPLYGALLLEIARRMRPLPGRLLSVATVTLMAVDLVENATGSAKLGAVAAGLPGHLAVHWGALFAAAASVALSYLFWARQTAGNTILANLSLEIWPAAQRRWRQAMCTAVLFIAAVLIAAMFVTGPQSATHDANTCVSGAIFRIVADASVVSHYGKLIVAGLVGAVLFVVGVAWLFWPNTPQADLSAVRGGVADIVVRTRYVLIVLAVFIALTLGLDQGRDVAIGLADAMLSPHALWAWPAFGLTVLAIWALSFSCWLWARLMCRMPGPSLGLRKTVSASSHDSLQLVARGIARVLGLVPPFVIAVMSGLAARDAVWAASYVQPPVVLTPFLLLLFGACSLLGTILFLWSREDVAHETPELYYDDPALADDWMEAIAKEKYRFISRYGPGPTALAILALVLAITTRCFLAVVNTHVPLAVCVIVLTLVAWLGVLGWLSLKEHREARPWSLAIIVAAGTIGYFGFADNHVVRIIRSDSSGILPAPGAQILGTISLATCVIVAALVIVRNTIRAHSGARRGFSSAWVLTIAAAVAIVVLLAVDRLSYQTSMTLPGGVSSPKSPTALNPSTAITSRQTLDEAFDQWSKVLVNGQGAIDSDPHNRKQVFFVASEGGGIRAAYWTARVLAELRLQIHNFDERTFMMSGVSGGSVGEAVYTACDLGDGTGTVADDAAVANCIRDFGEHDILTPMIGAWLFEDALARVLPTSLPSLGSKSFELCVQPGCGFLSRGLWFEQALEQAVPPLRLGIAYLGQHHAAWIPHLFLNSTWVETGDRAVASTVQVDWRSEFPEALDQIAFAARRGPEAPGSAVDMPLSTAAHNSGRFTFVNAIGVLRDADGQVGHLADGGYFDNSGSHTTIDVLGGFRSWLNGQRCLDQGKTACDWLQTLRPRILVIQNGITVNCDYSDGSRKQLDCLRQQWKIAAGPQPKPIYAPAQPATSGRLRLFADLEGPLVTVVNVGGTGGNGRRAQALIQEACRRLFPTPKSDDHPQDCTVQIAQRTDGVLYPLGWYLSPTARDALDKKAACEVRGQVLQEDRCKTDQTHCDCR